MSEGLEPCKGHRGDQEDDDRAPRLTNGLILIKRSISMTLARYGNLINHIDVTYFKLSCTAGCATGRQSRSVMMKLNHAVTGIAILVALAGCQRTSYSNINAANSSLPPLQAQPVPSVQSGALPPPGIADPSQFPAAPATTNPATAAAAPPATPPDVPTASPL
eukprot:gene46796-63403_t